jgi:peroxiredoxin
LEPWSDDFVMTDAEGQFSIKAPERRNSLLAYDRERRRGAVIVFDRKRPGGSLEARLRPLVRVFGTTRLVGGDKPMKWSCVYLNMPYEDADPLGRRRTAICGSFGGYFEFLLPPGTYEISASSDEPPASTVEDRQITLTPGQKDADLGSLVLRPSLGVQDRIDRAKTKGTWCDYKQNLGKLPPRWHLTDAKGVAKNAELSDFKGKWVMLYFWSPRCSPCLGKQLPELMAFYEAHKAQRDRFEVLAFCCDFEERLKNISELEKELAPVKKAVWGGRDLPFPVLMDNTFQTYEQFGLEGSGVSSSLLLIDPEGKLVEGDLKTLAANLERVGQNAR